MASVRQALGDEHLAYLHRQRSEIRMAGGLRNEVGGAFVGGLWVFEVASRARAVELIEGDPYYHAHPRAYRLLVWGDAFEDADPAGVETRR